jgi:hypothetical protein
MGKTYKKYNEEFSSERSGKAPKHSNGRKTGGMKTLNSYVEEDYDFDDTPFDDDVEINDEITIKHTKNT